MTKFKAGQKIRLFVDIAGLITEESGVVLNVDEEGVWLDNGKGNDPSGPFDLVTGENLSIPPSLGLGRQYIQP